MDIAMMQPLRGNQYRRTIVCIDSYESSILKGRFYSEFRKTGDAFESMMQFLLKMEHIINEMSFPQSFAEVRTFSAPPDPMAASPPEREIAKGELATFEVRILFRQNASWQGSITWLEEEQEESFRSVLELFLLMDSALNPERQKKTTA